MVWLFIDFVWCLTNYKIRVWLVEVLKLCHICKRAITPHWNRSSTYQQWPLVEPGQSEINTYKAWIQGDFNRANFYLLHSDKNVVGKEEPKFLNEQQPSSFYRWGLKRRKSISRAIKQIIHFSLDELEGCFLLLFPGSSQCKTSLELKKGKRNRYWWKSAYPRATRIIHVDL